jgi:hypothetical protein
MTIDALLGRGGMGLVYRARQQDPDRHVAVKLVAPELADDPEFRSRFERECEIAASLHHPHVLPIHDAGDQDGVLYLTMGFVDGTDLRDLLDKKGRLRPKRATRILAQVAEALDSAHAAGLVHRDVKPANVLLEDRDGKDHAYLTDFGLAKRIDSDLTLTEPGAWVGTIDYASPEQLRGDRVDARSDVYSLGCVLYRTLTGDAPFSKDHAVAKLFAHLEEPPPALPADVPNAELLTRVIKRAMAKEPEERFESAGDLARAASAAAEGKQPPPGGGSVARGPAAPLPQRRYQRRARFAFVAVSLIAAVVALVVLLFHDGQKRRVLPSGAPQLAARVEPTVASNAPPSAGGGSALDPTRQTPAAAVRAFWRALAGGDFTTAYAYLDPTSTLPYSRWLGMRKADGLYNVTFNAIANTRRVHNDAVVYADLTTKQTSCQDQHWIGTYNLVRIRGAWYIHRERFSFPPAC